MITNLNKLFIRVDANSQIGLGHLMRCIALAQEWKMKKGEVIFLVHYDNIKIEERILQEGFRLVSISNSCPEPNDLKETIKILNRETDTNSWVVLDGYHFDTSYQKMIKKNGNRLLVVDDNVHLKYYCADIILNQNINAKKVNYRCTSDTKLLLGLNYLLLRDEFKNYKQRERYYIEHPKNILVTMGGADYHNVTLMILKALNKVEINNATIKVIVGGCNSNIKILESEIETSTQKIVLLQDVSNMAELMDWA